MDASHRRDKVLKILNEAKAPITASALADELSVSRQVIVGDIALLRASGQAIAATPRGYVLESERGKQQFAYEGIIACKHSVKQLKEELYTVVDFGGVLIDVVVEHSLYGQLSGPLSISSRYEADLFVDKVSGEVDRPLSVLTGGIHLHTIGCADKQVFDLIYQALLDKGIALQK